MDNSDYILKWKEELVKQLQHSLSKQLIEMSYDRVDDVVNIIRSGELAIILSFISFIVINNGKDGEERISNFQSTVSSLVGSLCLNLLPITNVEEFDKILTKYRENLYGSLVKVINDNIISASKELDLETWIGPTTTLH